MSLEKNNTPEQTTAFQFNNYLKAGAVSMFTLGAYAIARATNFLPHWRAPSSTIPTEISPKSELSSIQLLQNAEASAVQSNVEVTSLKSAEGLSGIAGEIHPTGLAEFKEISLELPKAAPVEPQKTETTSQRRLLSQQTALNPIPDQVINVNEIWDFTIDVNEVFGPNIQTLAITGDFPSWMNPNYYPLLKNYPLPNTVNAVTIVGTKAYLTSGISGLSILYITNPFAPILLGTYDTPGTATKVVISNNIAYVVDGNSLQILNVTNPETPTYLSSYSKFGAVQDVALDDNLAYVVDGGVLQLLNISNVHAPFIMGNSFIVGVPNRLTTNNGVAYLATSMGVYTYSYVAPTLLGQYATPGMARRITVVGNVAYVGEESINLLQIINVTNPAAPTLLGQYATLGGVNGITIVDTIAYVAEEVAFNGIQIINITNLAAPTLLGQYATAGTTGYVYSVSVVNTTAYLAVYNVGLQIINVTNPAAPTLLGQYTSPGRARSAVVVGTMVYLAEEISFNGFQIINVANPAAPTLLGQYATLGGVLRLTVVGTIAYAAEYNTWKGLQIVNVANPAAPILLGQYPTLGSALGITVVDTTAYVAEYNAWNGVQIINVANPAAPTLVGQYATPGEVHGLQVVGMIAYIAEFNLGFQGLQIIRLGNLTNLDNYPTANPVLDINTVNGTATIALNNGGIQVLSLLNVSNLTAAKTISTISAAESVTQVGAAIYVSEGTAGFQIFNMAVNPPTLIGAYDTSGSVTSMVVAEKIGYVMDGAGGIQILNLAQAHLQGMPSLFNVGEVYTFTITATDTSGNWVTDSFKVTIARFPVLFHAITPPNAFWANKPISFTLPQDTFVDINNDPLTYSAGLTDQFPLLPGWLAFNGNNLTFSGTAIDVASPITFTIRVTAFNPLGGHVGTTFPLVVQPNVPPTLTNQLSDQFARVGTGFKFVIPQNTFIDAEGDSLTYRARLSDGSSFPAWLHFDGDSFSGTPGRADTGFYATRVLPILLTAQDGKFSTSTTFNINVEGTSGGELFVKIATPLVSVTGGVFGFYKKRSLLLNRCNKKKYERLGDTAIVGEAYSRSLDTPMEEVAVIQAKLPKPLSGYAKFFRTPRVHIAGGQLLPEWLFYHAATNSLRSRNGPESADIGNLIIQVKDRANIIREQFMLQVIPNSNTLDNAAPAAGPNDVPLSILNIR